MKILTKIQTHHVLALSGFLMFPVAVFGPLGYAVLFPVTAWLAFLIKFFEDRKFAPFSPRALMLLGGLHGWGLITAFWSVYQERTISLSISLVLLSLSGVVLWKVVNALHKEQRQAILKWMTAGLIIGLILLGVESFTQGMMLKWIKAEPDLPMYKFNKATSIFSIFTWIIAVGNYREGRRWLSVGLFLATAGVIFSLQSDSSKTAFVFGGLAFLLSYRFRRVPALASWALFFGILVMPLLSQTIFKPETVVQISPINCKNSLLHRLYVWEYVGTQIREKPLLGWGLDTARSEQFSHEEIDCKFNWEPDKSKDIENWKYQLSRMPALLLHPHNAALQWWLELGLVGVLIACFLIMQIPWELRNWTPKLRRASAFATFTNGTLIALISYGIWQNWWIATLWLAVVYGNMVLYPFQKS